MSSPKQSATAGAHELTGVEKLSRARALREMGEKFDDVIRQFVVAPDNEKSPRRDWALAEPFYPSTPESEQQRRLDKWALAEPFYPRQKPPQKKRPGDPRLDGLREHFKLSPRFYDTCDRCVSVREIGRAQHDLVAEYHRRPQLWMSPYLLTDVRKKTTKKVKITRWYEE